MLDLVLQSEPDLAPELCAQASVGVALVTVAGAGAVEQAVRAIAAWRSAAAAP